MNSHQSIPDKTLALSFNFLTDWESIQNFDLILAEQRKEDNSQITDMAAATCRNYFRNKHYIDWLIKKKATKRPRGRIRRIIGIALAQIIDQQIESSIICDTAVRFCKNKYSKFDANFVNHFLRSITNNSLLPPPKEVKLGLSPELISHWKRHFSEKEINSFAEVLKSPAPLTARLSPQNPDIEDLAKYLKPIELPGWSKNIKVFEVTAAKEFIQKNNGRLYIQDPAPLLAIGMLAPKPGETIADLCSAPGGKSLLIAQLMNNTGTLYSTDLSNKRLKTVEENLRGFSNCEIRQMDATNPDLKEKSLDGILLDVPCSNTGVIRRKADVRWTFSQKKIKELADIQYQILEKSSILLKSGGRIIYSTCSICPEENIGVVKRFIEKHPKFIVGQQITLFPSINHDGSFACEITTNT